MAPVDSAFSTLARLRAGVLRNTKCLTRLATALAALTPCLYPPRAVLAAYNNFPTTFPQKDIYGGASPALRVLCQEDHFPET